MLLLEKDGLQPCCALLILFFISMLHGHIKQKISLSPMFAMEFLYVPIIQEDKRNCVERRHTNDMRV